jgi:AcrR family transcriptional regulator
VTGRPRDPQVDQRITDATIDLLGEKRWPNVTADQIAERAGCGKAAIYRRWPNLARLVRDVVLDLGAELDEELAYPDGPGTLAEDLLAVVTAAVTGRDAAAVVGVMSECGLDPDLRLDYLNGPRRRLLVALDDVMVRALLRGGPEMPPYSSVLAAIRCLQWEHLISGRQPSGEDIAGAVARLLPPTAPEQAEQPGTAAPAPVPSHPQTAPDGAPQ